VPGLFHGKEAVLFLEPQDTKELPDFDTVSLVLYIEPVGRLVVRAISSSASEVTRRNILPGDVVVQINGVPEVHQSLLAAAEELSGTVGEQKKLRILRNGKSLNLTAEVARIL
jgi:C-terminal processing protease CtpA/Prc